MILKASGCDPGTVVLALGSTLAAEGTPKQHVDAATDGDSVVSMATAYGMFELLEKLDEAEE